MLDALSRMEPKVAAGVLSQLALSLDGQDSMSGPLVNDQPELARAILAQLKAMLGINPDDNSDQAIARVTDALDSEAQALVDPRPRSVDRSRLSMEGLLPPEAYEIVFDAQLERSFAKNWAVEKDLAQRCFYSPHRQEHHNRLGEDVAHVSIFARYFEHRFPARSFWLVIVGARTTVSFFVSQVWRIYAGDVDLSGCVTLLDVVQAFAHRFGQEIELDGRSGKFFLAADPVATFQAQHNLRWSNRKEDSDAIALFGQLAVDRSRLFIVMLVELTVYKRTVERWHGWDVDLLANLDIETGVRQGFGGLKQVLADAS